MIRCLVWMLFVMLMTNLAIPSAHAKPAWPIARGTFIQDYLVKDWTDAQWLAEYRAMKEVGMEYIIFGSTADSRRRITYYPTRLPGYRQAEGYDDPVDACLRNAKKAGIKVFLGLNFDGDWWKKSARDPEWLYDQMRQGNALADDLYARYHAKYGKTLYGWYWVWEVDNLNFQKPEERAVLAKALDINARHLHAISPGMPVMLCPFMNYRLGEPQAYADMWKDVFAHCDLGKGDIFCPQDCVGAGGLNIDNFASWFAALKTAVDSKPGLRFWSDTETFIQEDWTSAPLDRFVRQLKGVDPYVQTCVTFAWSHYYSPNNANPGFQKTLVGYVRTGKLEDVPPSAPADFTARRGEDGAIHLTWKPATDNVGVCGYYVYRDGKLISRKQMREEPAGALELTDKDLPAGMTYSYEIQAYDFAGNTSAKVGPARVAATSTPLQTTGSAEEPLGGKGAS